MHRLLLNSPNPELAVYDDASGEVVDRVPRGDRRDGNCYAVAERWVALYADGGGLILQIGTEKFALDAGATKLEYHHDWRAGETHFAASDPARRVALRYPSWWAKIGLKPAQVKFEPERDEDEDNLAYIYEVWKDPAQQQRLATLWARK